MLGRYFLWRRREIRVLRLERGVKERESRKDEWGVVVAKENLLKRLKKN